MGLFNILDPVLDFIFNPLLKLPSIVGIFVLSLLITFIITIIYKYTTDQKLLKSIREKQKKLQEEMRKSRDNPKKLMKMQKEAMESSMEMMRQSFKSMLYTFIPIIILFGWVSTHYAYAPFVAGEEFNFTVYMQNNVGGTVEINVPQGLTLLSEPKANITDKQASFRLRAETEGEHIITATYNGESVQKDVKVGGIDGYLKQTKTRKSFIDYIYGSREDYLPKGQIYMVKVDYDKEKPFGESFSLFGWQPGWLATYIIFSIALSIGIRKLMKVY